jgi:hypothetical protein
MVVHSYGNWFERSGAIKSEADPLDHHPARAMRRGFAAIRGMRERSGRAKPLPHVTTWLGQLAAGESGVRMFTQIRGAANDKAKHELPWRLTFPTWRDGFRLGLA